MRACARAFGQKGSLIPPPPHLHCAASQSTSWMGASMGGSSLICAVQAI